MAQYIQFGVFFTFDAFWASTLSLALTFGERNCSKNQLKEIGRDGFFYFAFIVEKKLLSFDQGILLKIGLGQFFLIIYRIDSSHYS